MNEERTLEVFVELSEVLTGFGWNTLAGDPELTRVKQEYFATVRRHVPAELFEALLTAYQGIVRGSERSRLEIEEEVTREIVADSRFGPVARNIVKMWYLGVWYNPPAQSRYGYVVSSEAYRSGLVWQVMQAHPVGDSRLPFGYWTRLPEGHGTAT